VRSAKPTKEISFARIVLKVSVKFALKECIEKEKEDSTKRCWKRGKISN